MYRFHEDERVRIEKLPNRKYSPPCVIWNASFHAWSGFRPEPPYGPAFFQGGQRTRRRRWKGCARGRRWEHYHEWMGKGVLQCSFLWSRVLGKLVVLGSFHLLKSRISLNHILRISYNTTCSLASSRQWKWFKTSSHKENATLQGCWKSLMAYYNYYNYIYIYIIYRYHMMHFLARQPFCDHPKLDNPVFFPLRFNDQQSSKCRWFARMFQKLKRHSPNHQQLPLKGLSLMRN